MNSHRLIAKCDVEQRMLVVAPLGRDAETLSQLLADAGVGISVCPDIPTLCQEIEVGAAGAILAEEALTPHLQQILADTLARQPEWSDFPLIVMAGAGENRGRGWRLLNEINGSAHAVLLQRPVRKVTLLSSARAALQSRARQYQVRDELLHREAVERALRESRRWFRDMADTAPAMLWVTDENHKCTFLSRGWYEFTGRAQTNGLATGWIEPVHPEDRARVEEIFRTAGGRREPFSLDYRLRGADGAYRWVINAGRPRMSEDGEFLGYIGSVVDVHERRLAEDAMRQERARLDTILEQLPAGVIIAEARSGRLLQGNKEASRIWRRDFIASRNVDEYVAYRGYHEDGRPYAVTEWPLARTITSGEIVEQEEIRIERGDGTSGWILTNSAPIRDTDGHIIAGVVTFTDITERKQAEEALRESEERLRLAQQVASIGTFEWDIRSNVHVWSRELEALYGLPAGGFNGTYAAWADRVHPEDLPEAERRIHASLETGQFEAEWRAVRPDGTVRWLAARGFVFKDATGRPSRMIGVNVDIDDRKRAEQMLKQSHDELELRVAERTATLKRQNQQLRRLANQLTETEQRERRNFAESLHDGLQQILVAAKMQLGLRDTRHGAKAMERLAGLLEDAISASRSLSYQLSPPVVRSSTLPEAFHWLADWFSANQHFEVELRMREEVPELADHAKTFLFSAARELLLNSVKHSGTDFARLELWAENDGQVCVCIADEGRGFDPEQLQGGAGDSPGFGLSSIRERVMALGGSFRIDATRGAGARFELRIPLDQQPRRPETPRPAPIPDKSQPESGPKGSTDRPVRLLLVDDHGIVRQGLLSLLEGREGIEIVGQACDGREAIERTDELLPDAVLIDVSMPRMNGIEATREISRRHPDITIIGLSFRDGPDVAEAMLRAGASAYLQKDGDVEVLLECIRGARRRNGPQETE